MSDPLWWTDVRPEPKPRHEPKPKLKQTPKPRELSLCADAPQSRPRQTAEQRRQYKTAKQREYNQAKYAAQIATGVKHCKGCDTTKPLSEFPADASKPLGVRPRCRDCYNASLRARYERNRQQRPPHWGEPSWRRRHGRKFDKERMLAEQAGLCYLCRRPLPAEAHLIHLDHDHTHCPQGKSCPVCRRGLACGQCNTAIGLAADDPTRLRLMADNLEQAQAEVRQRIQMEASEAC